MYTSPWKRNKKLPQASDSFHSSFQKKEIVLWIKFDCSASLYWRGKKNTHLEGFTGQMIPFPELCDLYPGFHKGPGMAQWWVFSFWCFLFQLSNWHLKSEGLYNRKRGLWLLSEANEFSVCRPLLCAGGGPLGLMHKNDSSCLFFSVGDVQLSCYHILCSLYSLGTGKNIYVER